MNEWSGWVTERAKLALTPDAPFGPSNKACKYCLHQHNCVALADHVNDVVTGDFDNLEDLEGQVDKVSTEHIKRVLDNMDLIKGFLKAVEEVALERMQAGEAIDGYKLVKGRKNKAWLDEEQAIKILAAKLEPEDMFTQKLITPTQALKLLGKKNQELIDEVWSVPEGEPTIVTISDSRPSILSVSEEFDSLS